MNNICILGCGRWGSFLAWYFNRVGLNVTLWGRRDSLKYKNLYDTRKNEYVILDEKIKLTNDLDEALGSSDYIFISINEQNLRSFMQLLIRHNVHNKKIVLCMKGLEKRTQKRLSEIVLEYVSNEKLVAVMLGPGQPKELVNNNPTHMIIDSIDYNLSCELSKMCSSSLINFSPSRDIVGNEIGAALCKIIGIAGGILEAYNLFSLKSVLMVEGTKEISKIIEIFGGDPMSAYGLSCLGDYNASLYSINSNSIAFGKNLVSNGSFSKHTPGAFLADNLLAIIKSKQMELPLLNIISLIIIKKREPKDLINFLVNRRL